MCSDARASVWDIRRYKEADQEAEPSGFTLPAHSNSSKTRERDGTQHKGTWEHTHTQGKTTRGGREGASRPPHTKVMAVLSWTNWVPTN